MNADLFFWLQKRNLTWESQRSLKKALKFVPDRKRKAKTTAGFVEQGKDLWRYKRKVYWLFLKWKFMEGGEHKDLKTPQELCETASS
jgi:hypothetical protein